MNAPSVIPQLILNLCTLSIATCNKFFGFTLTPEGIKLGKNKLKAIKDAKLPTDVKMIRSFVRLCNFFRTHIKNFAIIAAPLFRLTRKDCL